MAHVHMLHKCRVQIYLFSSRYWGYFQGLSEVLDHFVELLVWSMGLAKLQKNKKLLRSCDLTIKKIYA